MVIDGKFVLLPINDLRVITAKRIVADDLARERALKVGLLEGNIRDLKAQIKIKDEEIALGAKLLSDCDDAYWKVMGANTTLSKKNKRNKKLYFAGGVVVGVGVVYAGAYVYQMY